MPSAPPRRRARRACSPAAGSSTGVEDQQASRGNNIVLLVADDLGYADSGLAAERTDSPGTAAIDVPRTPRLSALAAAGGEARCCVSEAEGLCVGRCRPEALTYSGTGGAPLARTPPTHAEWPRNLTRTAAAHHRLSSR